MTLLHGPILVGVILFANCLADIALLLCLRLLQVFQNTTLQLGRRRQWSIPVDLRHTIVSGLNILLCRSLGSRLRQSGSAGNNKRGQ